MSGVEFLELIGMGTIGLVLFGIPIISVLAVINPLLQAIPYGYYLYALACIIVLAVIYFKQK